MPTQTSEQPTAMYHLSAVSSNAKTGPIAVSTSSKETCPAECGMKHICYASFGHLNLHWKAVSEGRRGVKWKDFLLQVGSLPKEHKFRHNQAGDLPQKNGKIDAQKLKELSEVINKRKLKAWSYTHYEPKGNNLRAIRAAIKKGFIVNISADSLEAADKARKLGLPTTVVLSHDAPEKFVTPKGNRGIVCPQQTGRVANCASCLLCNKERNIIVGFLAHGTKKKTYI